MHLIETDDALGTFCQDLAGENWIAVDTEFVRERTYFPQLCLVQVAGSSTIGLVDTLALPKPDRLHTLLLDTTITKVIHAARQDLEVLHQSSGSVPTPVFDTQIAADLCGLGDQSGLAAVAAELLGVEVDKTHARADWTQRPLPARLQQYAASDVDHLLDIAGRLHERLRQLGRVEWLEEECSRLADPALYQTDPDTAWRRIKGIRRLDGSAFHTARELAAWRERRAISRNKPRQWVLRDDVLLQLAASQPRSLQALQSIGGLPAALLRHCGTDLLKLVARAQDCSDPVPATPQPLSAQQKATLNRMMAVVRDTAAELGVSPALLATRRDVTRLVRARLDTPVLSGWRRAVIGNQLLEISAA